MIIDIVKTKTTNKPPMNIGSVLIMFFQKTNYSHYAIRVTVGNKVNFYDSSAKGTRRQESKNFLKKHKIVEVIKFSNKISYVMWSNFISRHMGKPYGFLQVLGLAFKIIKNNPFGGGKKRIICNELVILMLNYYGYTKIKDTDSLDLNETDEIIKKVLR